MRVDFTDCIESISLLFPDSVHADVFTHALQIHVLHMLHLISEKECSRCGCEDTQFGAQL